jgi:hypothetical protein
MKVERVDAVIARLIGRIGNTVYMRREGEAYYARAALHDTGESPRQKAWRGKYSECDVLWADLTEDEKLLWHAKAHGAGNTRYSVFMHVNLLNQVAGSPLQRVP